MKNKVAIVAGASGIVGRGLVEHLTSLEDWDIIGLVRKAHDDAEGEKGDIQSRRIEYRRSVELVQSGGQTIGYIGGVLLPSSEMFMNDSLSTLSCPAIPSEVQGFAAEKGVRPYLNAVIDLAWQAFPSSALCVSLGQDAEDEMHQYIALDVEVGGQATAELLAGQRMWSAGISRVCLSHHAIYFVLGWR